MNVSGKIYCNASTRQVRKRLFPSSVHLTTLEKDSFSPETLLMLWCPSMDREWTASVNLFNEKSIRSKSILVQGFEDCLVLKEALNQAGENISQSPLNFLFSGKLSDILIKHRPSNFIPERVSKTLTLATTLLCTTTLRLVKDTSTSYFVLQENFVFCIMKTFFEILVDSSVRYTEWTRFSWEISSITEDTNYGKSWIFFSTNTSLPGGFRSTPWSPSLESPIHKSSRRENCRTMWVSSIISLFKRLSSFQCYFPLPTIQRNFASWFFRLLPDTFPNLSVLGNWNGAGRCFAYYQKGLSRLMIYA